MNPALVVLCVIVVPQVIEIVASLLQRSWIGRPVPPDLVGIYEDSEYATSNEYTREKSTQGLLKQLWDNVVFIAFWFVGGFGVLQAYCIDFGWSEPVAGLVFFGILSVAEQLLSLPWSIYHTFVLEEKYGFNNTTAATFVKDRVKGLVVLVLLGGPILFAVQWFFLTCGSSAWLYAWIFLAVFQVTLFFLAPVLLLPLFLQMTPLPEGTAMIVEGLEKKGAHKYLNRIFFEVTGTAHNEKPVWTTRDRQFDGASKGQSLCLFCKDGQTWVIADGEFEGGAVSQEQVLAVSTTAAAAPHLVPEGDWLLSAAGHETAGTAPLLANKMQVKEARVGDLRRQLLELAAKCEYSCNKLFIIDGSTRSSHSNAFCTGFGEFRRICLFDTLLSQMSNDEITAVLGHEIGHDKLNHTVWGLVLGLVLSFVQFFMLGKFINDPFLAKAFFLSKPSVYTGILLFSIVWGVVEFFLSVPLTVNSRMNEYAADRFAVEANQTYAKHLSQALKALMKNSKANLTPHPFYVFLHHSHPPMDLRLKAIWDHQSKAYSQ